MRLPKSFRAYLWYIYQTDGSRALIRGLLLLSNRVLISLYYRLRGSRQAAEKRKTSDELKEAEAATDRF